MSRRSALVSPPRAREHGFRAARVRREAGFSYMEVLIATVLIALALSPAIEGLSVGTRSAGAHLELAEANFHLASLMEDVLARSIPELEAAAAAAGSPATATSLSDAPGSANRRLVYIALYDGDDADGDGDRFTGGDAGLLWVRVAIENSSQSLETLTTQ